MNKKKQHLFSSIEQSTSFKRTLDKYRVNNVGFADLNAHLIDEYIVNKSKYENNFKYAFIKLAWVVSKLFKKKIKLSGNSILLAPAEMDKDRSIGLYTPLLRHLEEKKYDLFSTEQLFASINFLIFLKWLITIPSIIRDVQKALKDDASGILKEIKGRLYTDSIIYSLWIRQLRFFFKASAYRSVLVDWDRHTLQSLVVLAAKMEAVEAFTFVHGAIYTPEKFVPLIADKCLIWGNRHRQFFTGLGEAEGRLIKAGNTRFSKKLPDRETVLNKYKINGGKKIILHPSQNFPDLEDNVIIENIYRNISKNENFQLAVKFHPSQNNSELIKKIKGLDNLILLDQSVTASEALAIADFTIIVSSTFSIDAMISGVPVAVYKQPATSLRGIAIDLVEKANVPLLQTEKDFSDLLMKASKIPADQCFDMRSQQTFINDYCEFFGDESAKLISELL